MTKISLQCASAFRLGGKQFNPGDVVLDGEIPAGANPAKLNLYLSTGRLAFVEGEVAAPAEAGKDQAPPPAGEAAGAHPKAKKATK